MKQKSLGSGVLTVGSVCLLLTFSGCQVTTLGSTIGYQLYHDIPIGEAVCVGGLKGKLSSDITVMFESPIVPLGEDYDENILRGKIDKGDEVLAEAWCYGAEGEEIGYIAAEGRLVPSYDVGVIYNEPLNGPLCLTGRTSGEYIPCITSGIIEQ